MTVLNVFLLGATGYIGGMYFRTLLVNAEDLTHLLHMRRPFGRNTKCTS